MFSTGLVGDLILVLSSVVLCVNTGLMLQQQKNKKNQMLSWNVLKCIEVWKINEYLHLTHLKYSTEFEMYLKKKKKKSAKRMQKERRERSEI